MRLAIPRPHPFIHATPVGPPSRKSPTHNSQLLPSFNYPQPALTDGPDIVVKLIEEPRKPTRTRNRKASARSNNSSTAAAAAKPAEAQGNGLSP